MDRGDTGGMKRSSIYDFLALKFLRASRFDMSIQPIKCCSGSQMLEAWVVRVEWG